MYPQIFGKEHIIYIVISILVGTAICVLSKLFAKTEKSKDIVVRCAGGVLFAIIVVNRIVVIFEYDTPNWLKLFPESFCTTSSIVLSLAVLLGKKDNDFLHFLWLVALGGGTITTFYPTFIAQNPSFTYVPTMFGLLHHTFSAILVILMLMFKYVNLTYKKWYCTLWGFMSYLAYGAFLMCVLNFSNPFFMTQPAIDGTPFTVWIIAPIYIAVYAIILLTVELVRKKKNKKKES